MRHPADTVRTAERLHRRLAVHAEVGAQVVFVDRAGRVDFCASGSPRHLALESRPDFQARIAGVFDASASVPLLAAALREVVQ